MAEVKWEPVDVTPRSVPRGKPYVRVTTSSVTFNAVATALIDDIDKYEWAVVRVGLVDDEPAMLAFQFVQEQTPEAFPVKRQSKQHKGITFFSRELVKRYFRFSGIGIVYMMLDVEKQDDTTLVVKLPTEKYFEDELGLDKIRRKAEEITEVIGDEIDRFVDNVL